jgi:hypothetical protein
MRNLICEPDEEPDKHLARDADFPAMRGTRGSSQKSMVERTSKAADQSD